MTSTDQYMFEPEPPINRLAYRNLFIYDSHYRDIALGGLRVAEGITDTGLYSMVEILCIFTNNFVLEDENQRQCAQASRPPFRHRQDCSPGRPGGPSQAVGQEPPSFGKDYRLRG